MTIHVSRKLKNTNQRLNALEKRIADLEKMLKSALSAPPLWSTPQRPPASAFIDQSAVRMKVFEEGLK